VFLSFDFILFVPYISLIMHCIRGHRGRDRMVVGYTTICAIIGSTNKTDRHNITEILLRMVLNTITLTLTHSFFFCYGLFTRMKEIAKNCDIIHADMSKCTLWIWL
jgi:hypothetical protein